MKPLIRIFGASPAPNHTKINSIYTGARINKNMMDPVKSLSIILDSRKFRTLEI